MGPKNASFSGFIISAFGSKSLLINSVSPNSDVGRATATFGAGEIYLDGDFGTAYTIGSLPFAGFLIDDSTLHTGLCKANETGSGLFLQGTGYRQTFSFAKGVTPPVDLSLEMDFPRSFLRVMSLNSVTVVTSTLDPNNAVYAMRWVSPGDTSLLVPEDSVELSCVAFSPGQWLRVTGNYSIWSNSISISATAKIGDEVTITDGNSGLNSFPSFGASYSVVDPVSGDSVTRIALAEIVSQAAGSVTLVIPPMPGITSADIQWVGFFIFISSNFSPFFFDAFTLDPVSVDLGPFEFDFPDGIPNNLDVGLISFTVNIPDTSGVYTLVKGKSDDTVYDQDLATTEQVKIPTPFIKTGFIGG